MNYKELIRIVESLQAAVEQIPIREAFDELDTERNYHQEKRKESNERTEKLNFLNNIFKKIGSKTPLSYPGELPFKKEIKLNSEILEINIEILKKV